VTQATIASRKTVIARVGY